MLAYSKLEKAYFETQTSDPATFLAAGRFYYKSDSNLLKWYTGSVWKTAVDTDSTQTLSGKTHTDPVLNGTISGTGFLDEDNMASDSATKLASQQSIKAYVDAAVANATNNPNVFINGGMHYWQRGTSFASIADATYSADRMKYFKATTGAVNTIAQESTIIPTVTQAGGYIPYSLKVTVGTADASVAAGDLVYLRSTIEGLNYAEFHGQAARLQFWVYSSKTGTYCVSFRNSAADRSYVAEYTISSSNTWERKLINLTMDSSGTWLFDTGAGVHISWCLMGGSTYQTTANTWAAGNFFCTSSQTNWEDNTANTFYLTGIQFVKGSFGATALNFYTAGKNAEQELHYCQRYMEKTTNPTVTVDTVTDVGAIVGSYSGLSSGICALTHIFKATKRVAPTSSVYNPVTGVNNGIRVGASNEGASLVAAGMGSVGASAGGNFSGQTSLAKAHFISDSDF